MTGMYVPIEMLCMIRVDIEARFGERDARDKGLSPAGRCNTRGAESRMDAERMGQRVAGPAMAAMYRAMHANDRLPLPHSKAAVAVAACGGEER